MRVRLTVALLWIALGASMLGQAGGGTIAGRVTDEHGVVVTGQTVEARNTATGTVYKASIQAQGDYTLSQLPTGKYDVSIASTRGAFTEALYSPFQQKDVAVEAGRTVKLDISMKVQGNLATLGDQPIALLNGMRSRTAIPTGPAPRGPNGKPDLSGFWLNITAGVSQFDGGAPASPPLQPWAEKAQKERQASRAPSPLSLCLPAGPIPIMSDFPYQLVQTSTMLVMLQDLNFPGWRQVFLDGRPHPPPTQWNPAYFGHSIGKWEGDTLVVDSVGFNDSGGIGGAPHTEQLHVVERYTRPDAGHLEVDVIIEDPGALTAPWKRHVSATLGGKDEQILEYLCENNVFPQHLVK